MRWILDHVDGARDAAAQGHLAAGTIDSWVLWQATGGPEGGVHATDVTNASRTMLMDLRSLDWDDELCEAMGVPRAVLPEIRSSSEVYGVGRSHGLLPGVPFAGILGDQQAATFGQGCFSPGDAKNTYGTGNFMLLTTGTEPVRSRHGLLTTLAYRLGDAAPVYALEGAVAVTGSLVQWLRDNLGIIGAASEIEALAASVEDNGGVYVVPAFSGLFAPYWRPDARGVITGLTRYATKAHLARASLEAVAFQSAEVAEAMQADSGVALTELRVDGGMVANELLLQLQADLLGVDVVRPVVSETTALGAAYAAGLAVGFWSSTEEIAANWAEDRRWSATRDDAWRERELRRWRKAVTRSFDWIDEDER
jgi:glycerol kinase